MYRSILLRNKLRSFESASEQETNFLHAVRNHTAAEAFKERVWGERAAIEAVVRHHLRLGKNVICRLLPEERWFQGGFNICGIVEVEEDGAVTPFIFRCPMPHKLAEDRYPGTVSDKVACEAGTYIWVQERCPEIRVPKLYAFGTGNNNHFTHVDCGPFHIKAYRAVQRWIYRLFCFPLLSKYHDNKSAPTLDTAYMLLEYIRPEAGEPLMYSWAENMNDSEKQKRLFKGMSRIMLSLAKIPQPHIGSFRFNPRDATVSLSARPLTCTMMLFEQGDTPRTIQPNQIYHNSDSFASDMLTLYDNHLLHEPHSVRDSDDAQERMTIRTMLRTVAHRFVLPERRNGPFMLQLTDFHQSNIMVDEEWNVTCLIDLEWISALPVESLSVPYWLTGCSIDGIQGDAYAVFDEARQLFLQAMDDEERQMQMEHDIPITKTMRDSWDSKAVWFWACLRSINGWLFVFEDHILAKFSESDNNKFIFDLKQLSTIWHEDIAKVIERKVADEEQYQEELRRLFLSKEPETEKE